MPPLNIVLRSKTQVVDDSTRTKSSLTQCTLKECAGLKSHSFCTQFQPTTSTKPRTNHRSSATHRQNEPSEHYDKRKEGTSPWGANTRVAGNHSACQNQPKARGTRLRARRSYAGCTTAEIRVACHGLLHEFGEISSCEAGPEDAGSQPSAVSSSAFWPANRAQLKAWTKIRSRNFFVRTSWSVARKAFRPLQVIIERVIPYSLVR